MVPQDDGSQTNDDDTKSTRIYRQPIPPLPSLVDDERKLPRPGKVTSAIWAGTNSTIQIGLTIFVLYNDIFFVSKIGSEEENFYEKIKYGNTNNPCSADNDSYVNMKCNETQLITPASYDTHAKKYKPEGTSILKFP